MSTKTPYEKAVARRRELQSELERIDAFLEMYKEFADEAPASVPPSNGAHPPAGMTQGEFVTHVRRLLKEKQRPATRGQIVRMLKEKNIHVGGVNESKNVGTKLWRARDVFVNIEGKGYWLKDEACPAVSYYPTASGETAH